MAVIKDANWLKSLCRSHTEANITMLAGYANSEEVHPELRMRAAGMLMDRGWGKPSQDNTHEVKGEFSIILRDIMAEKKLKK